MVWDFKRLLYCSEERKSLALCADLGDERLRRRIQQHFDGRAGFPRAGSDDEYAALFELAYPSEADRRAYIESAVRTGRPSYGHLALCALMAIDRARLLWTTNFDRLLEDAAAMVFGTSGRLVVAAPETGDVAGQAVNEGRWPVLGKLHGDFQSRRLRNTAAELRQQDARLRAALLDSTRRFGLVVAGCSGRDHSVMETLTQGLDSENPYPSGLFWLHHGQGGLLHQAQAFVDQATRRGVDAHVVNISTFDELMADVLLLVPQLPPEVQVHLDARGARVSDAPLPPATQTGWPVVRLNALRMNSVPTVCRIVECSIGGAKDTRHAIEVSKAELVVARRNIGVLAFGSDAEVRRVFDPHNVTRFDLHALDARRLMFESAELGLLYDAFARALVRERPLLVERRGRGLIAAVDPLRADDQVLAPLVRAAGEITGTVGGTSARWAEAFRFRLESRFEAMWLLFEPTIWCEHTEELSTWERCRDFIRERVAARYNQRSNDLIAAWAEVVTAGAPGAELRALGIADGVDAVFAVQRTTAFSHRVSSPAATSTAGGHGARAGGGPRGSGRPS